MAPAAPAGMRVVEAVAYRDATSVRTDEQLLKEFRSGTGETAEAAFTTLVERYTPIVHRVCVDVLQSAHEAQDAAQAVFLVLARKADSIRKPESLGPWLHGVAVRVARRSRSEAARRKAVERRKAEIFRERDTGESRPELMDHAALHDEIDRLPEKYRQPIVLCYLQGQTQPQAAQTLGWPLGTVQIRLHRGRERLRSRLTRSGAGLIALPNADLIKSVSESPGGLGQEWTEATARAAVRFAVGKEMTGVLSPLVIGLAESTLTAMLVDSLKLGALAAIFLCCVSACVYQTGLSAGRSRHQETSGEHAATTLVMAKPEPNATNPVIAAPVPNVADFEPPASAIGRVEKTMPSVSSFEKSTESVARSSRPSADRRHAADALASPPTSPGMAEVAIHSEKTRNFGRQLFERVWVKDDRRAHGGDGLGPVFNGQSCVDCHNQGGTGGAGNLDRNIEIASVSETPSAGEGYFYSFSMDFGAGRFEYKFGDNSQWPDRRPNRTDSAVLAGVHPAFRDARSVVLHRYGTDPEYNAWRGSVPGRHGAAVVHSSLRSPPALFGAGLIDAIPDEAIEAAARRKFPGSAQVKGRVSRLKNDRIGRFGWKAQTATLEEFVHSAAAGEMGLEIPALHQAADPRLPGVAAPGLDMNQSECDALVEFVRSLPAPVAGKAADAKKSAQWKAGEATFKSIGCTACHLPKLGDVDGIYSDLLLHDLGPQLGDGVEYTVFVGKPADAAAAVAPDRPRAARGTAADREWRTPPLWGIADSGPYMHDGRAATLAEAITMHGGQGATAARKYAELAARRKQQVEAFLMSLASPAAKR